MSENLLLDVQMEIHVTGDRTSINCHSFGLVRHDLPTFAGLRAIPLVAPEAQQAVGLVVSERDPLSPLVRALVEVAQQFDLSGQLESANTNLTEAKG